MNYTEIEAKVREATNDEQWGPTGQQMNEIASHTFSYESFPEVMGMLWKRMLQDNKTNWRRTYKSLILLNYLVRNGSERVVTSSREHVYDLRSLETYTFHDELGKDMGVNVRHRAKLLVEFIQDDDRLREERKKAKKNKDKYIGVSADAMAGGFGSYGRSSGGGGGGGGYSDSWAETKDPDDEVEEEPRKHKSSFEDLSPVSEDSNRSSPLRKPSPLPPASTNTPSIGVVKPLPSKNKGKTNVSGGKKTIDLGAAANYKGDVSLSATTSLPQESKNTDLLADLFSIDSAPQSVCNPVTNPVSNPMEEFADFSSFPASDAPSSLVINTVTSNEDNFADFASAFSDSSAVATAIPSVPASCSVNLLSDNLLDTSLITSGPASLPVYANSFGGLATPITSPNSPTPGATQPSLLEDSLTSLTHQIAQTTLQPLKPNSSGNNNTNETKYCVPSNTTWGSLGNKVNIDVDNLLGSKYDKKTAPSMNQLAAGVTVGSSRVAPVSNNTSSGICWTSSSTPSPTKR